MRKILISVCLTFLSIHCLAQECKQIRVASGAFNWEPISYQNKETLKYYGVAFDVLNEVVKRLDLSVIILDLPFKRLLMYLENGSLDIALALYKNKERETKYLYTRPYFSNEARIFVKKGKEFPFNSLEDLVGRDGMAPAGGSFGDKFDSFANANLNRNLHILYKKPFKETFHKFIINERKDYYIADFLDGMMGIKRAGLEDEIVPLAHPIGKNDVHFAFSRKSHCTYLIDDINQTIEQLMLEGFVSRLTEKYK